MTDEEIIKYVHYLRHHASGHPQYLHEAADMLLALKARAEAAEKRINILVEGLEIIAGRRQCIDNLMSNIDVAIAALEAKP